jgi:hypothetical protein
MLRPVLLLTLGLVAAGPRSPSAEELTLPPANGPFSYQLGGAYRPPAGTRIVTRDREEPAVRGVYSICYVNAFQTQPGERKHWPRGLVLTRLGDDPGWPGEFAVDISTARKRARAARFVGRWVRRCAAKGFAAVEYDNLDSWTRFAGAPFGRADAVAYAHRLVRAAHRNGLAAAQKNTVEVNGRRSGFDFAVAEECGRWRECGRYRRMYGDHVLAIEYRRRDMARTCRVFSSVVLRDVDLVRPGQQGYRFGRC